MKKKRGLDDLAHELDCISATLTSLGYSIDGCGEFDLSRTSAQNIIYGCACYIDRVIEDLNNYE